MSEIDPPILHAPLPGGSAGAVVTLRPFSTGEMGAPRGFLSREEGRLSKAKAFGDGAIKKIETWVPCPIFYVEHPTAGKILIDTGIPAAVAHDPKAGLGRLASSLYALRAKPDQPLPARLRQLAIEPDGIDTVIMTHLHLDHAGGLQNLEGVTVVVAQREWRSAHGSRGLARGYLKRQFEHAHDYQLIDYDQRSINSFASFGRSFDLFGDGSIVLVSTPGHSSGHQSVVLRMKSREVLLVGDASYTRRNLDQGELPLVVPDEHNYKRSVREIRAYAQMTPGALVILGHDPEEFAELEEFYD